MFGTKRCDSNTAKSIAGQYAAEPRNELNAYKSQTGQQLAAIKKELDFEENSLLESLRNNLGTFCGLQLGPKRTIKYVIKSLESRLDHQEKMQKMLFDHLGIEYAKITEETKAGKREKEVLRRAKKK